MTQKLPLWADAGGNYYLRLYQYGTLHVWNGTNYVANPAWALTAITATWNAATGVYEATLPEGLPASRLFGVFYERAGTDPAITDDRQVVKEFDWTGTQIMPEDSTLRSV